MLQMWGHFILSREQKIKQGMHPAGMKSAGKNHPWERIFTSRDEINGEESSLRENYCRQGWNQRGRIILEREFLPAGMKSAGKNHPWERIFAGRDEINSEVSSLRENFYQQGWNQQGRIILGRELLPAGMKSTGKNHPWERIFAGRDEINRKESSLRENFCQQGWNQHRRGTCVLGITLGWDFKFHNF